MRVIVQYRLPLHDEAVDSDCRPTMMGGRLVMTVVGRTRYPNGLEHEEDEKIEANLLHSRAAMAMNNQQGLLIEQVSR